MHWDIEVGNIRAFRGEDIAYRFRGELNGVPVNFTGARIDIIIVVGGIKVGGVSTDGEKPRVVVSHGGDCFFLNISSSETREYPLGKIRLDVVISNITPGAGEYQFTTVWIIPSKMAELL